VFVCGTDLGYPSGSQTNKYMFGSGFWVPNITTFTIPVQNTNVTNWMLTISTSSNGGTSTNPVIYLTSSSGGDTIWYNVTLYPTTNYLGNSW
jgi:hypothetical protein